MLTGQSMQEAPPALAVWLRLLCSLIRQYGRQFPAFLVGLVKTAAKVCNLIG